MLFLVCTLTLLFACFVTTKAEEEATKPGVEKTEGKLSYCDCSKVPRKATCKCKLP
jgi:hypothetical protein